MEGAGSVGIIGDVPREAWLERGDQRAEVGQPVSAGGWTLVGRFDDGLPGFLAEVRVQPDGVVEVKCDAAFKRCRVP